MKPKELIKLLEKEGFMFVRGNPEVMQFTVKPDLKLLLCLCIVKIFQPEL
jgi:predicted RNA binding protein YcfA (HicA-like mRNA interferase family)